MAVNPIPGGYQTVVPYLIVTDAALLIEFVKASFGATERMRSARPDGTIMHAEIQLGDSVIMLADAADGVGVKTVSWTGDGTQALVSSANGN